MIDGTRFDRFVIAVKSPIYVVPKTQNINESRLALQLPLSNPLKPGVTSKMKMLQLHLSDQQVYCLMPTKVRLVLEVWRQVCFGCNWMKMCTHFTPIFVHYSDVTMGAMASRITSLPIVYLTVYSGADQRKHQSSVSLAFVRGIHRWPVNSTKKWPVTRKMLPFDDVIMCKYNAICDYKEVLSNLY